ncbi:MAG: YXWGXW repeat-containing protein [Ramlibacter sp.]|nr:YXWGXW repeat-containing protein [Ramlibacter sp.]
MFKKTLMGAVLAAGSLLSVLPGVANAQFVVSVAPPAPVVEVQPAPRHGYVWAQGHHEWRGNQYVWVPGHWLTAREGYEYRNPQWVQRGNGQWAMVGGNWERRGPYGDRDRDGIPNAYDSHNDRSRMGGPGHRMGPYGDMDRDGILNKDDRDRDGDGVRNNRDRYPDDRRRS